MKQHEFIFMARNMTANEIIQNDPEVIVNLKEDILLKHNYKKKNQMIIEFKELKQSFLVPTKKELEEIYRILLSNLSFKQLLYDWCNKNITKIS